MGYHPMCCDNGCSAPQWVGGGELRSSPSARPPLSLDWHFLPRVGAGGGRGTRYFVGDWTGDSHHVVRVLNWDCKAVLIITHYHTVLDNRRAARGEIVKTVNLSCSASEGILGLQLKALQAAQEEVIYRMKNFLPLNLVFIDWNLPGNDVSCAWVRGEGRSTGGEGSRGVLLLDARSGRCHREPWQSFPAGTVVQPCHSTVSNTLNHCSTSHHVPPLHHTSPPAGLAPSTTALAVMVTETTPSLPYPATWR